MKLPIAFNSSTFPVKIQRAAHFVAVSGTEILVWATDSGTAMGEAADKLVGRWSDEEKLLEELTTIKCYPATTRLVEALPTDEWDLREDGVADLSE